MEGIFGEDYKVHITLVCDKCHTTGKLLLNIDDMEESLKRYGWYAEKGDFLCYECNTEENLEWLSSEEYLKRKKKRLPGEEHWT